MSPGYSTFLREYVNERRIDSYEEMKDGFMNTFMLSSLTKEEVLELQQMLVKRLRGSYKGQWVAGLKELKMPDLAHFLEELLPAASATNRVMIIEDILSLGLRKWEHLEYLQDFSYTYPEPSWRSKARQVFEQYR